MTIRDTTDTKQLLMNISMELFQEKDFDDVSVDEICKKAGVTKGSFYHHFDSKYDIPIQQYRAIQNEFYNDYERNANLPLLQRFERAIMWYADYCTKDTVNIITNYHKVMMNYTKNTMLRKIEIETKVFGEILNIGIKQKIFRDDINIHFYGEMIARFISSLLLDWAIFKGNINIKRELAYLYRTSIIILLDT